MHLEKVLYRRTGPPVARTRDTSPGTRTRTHSLTRAHATIDAATDFALKVGQTNKHASDQGGCRCERGCRGGGSKDGRESNACHSHHHYRRCRRHHHHCHSHRRRNNRHRDHLSPIPASKAENNKQLLEQFHRDTVTRVRAGVDVGDSAKSPSAPPSPAPAPVPVPVPAAAPSCCTSKVGSLAPAPAPAPAPTPPLPTQAPVKDPRDVALEAALARAAELEAQVSEFVGERARERVSPSPSSNPNPPS